MRHIPLIGKRSFDFYRSLHGTQFVNRPKHSCRTYSESAGDGDGTFRRVQQLYVFIQFCEQQLQCLLLKAMVFPYN